MATISKGNIESGPITVTQSGGSSVEISLGTAPAVPSADYQGIATAVGNPLTPVGAGNMRAHDSREQCHCICGGWRIGLRLGHRHALAIRDRDDGSQQSDPQHFADGDFSGLSNLKTLWLYDNRLGTLPDTVFASLSNLRFLSLYRNRLTVLPDTVFASLDSLKTLHLNDNRLSTLPDTVFAGMDSLQTLLMDNNTLSTLPDTAFYDLPHLQTLHLNSNRLSALPRQRV